MCLLCVASEQEEPQLYFTDPQQLLDRSADRADGAKPVPDSKLGSGRGDSGGAASGH